MKRDVSQAITAGIIDRRRVLSGLTPQQRTRLLEALFVDFFGHQHVTLQKWAALTGQSAQVDTGYIAQFIASISLSEPGQGFRGKGDDLADGSEVKSAANISGVDTPRWNHNVGTPADDASRRAKGIQTRSEEYLSLPYFFYLLVDRPSSMQKPVPLRIRAWCVDAQRDDAWRSLIKTFVDKRIPAQYNLQLHPPVGGDDNLVANTLGNLDFTDVLLFDAQLALNDRANPKVSWKVPLRDEVFPISGRTVAKPHKRAARGLHGTAAADLVADIAVLPSLFPGILSPRDEQVIEEAASRDSRGVSA